MSDAATQAPPSWRGRALGLALGALLLGALGWQLAPRWAELRAAGLTLRPGFLALAFGFLAAYFLTASFLWAQWMRAIGAPLPWRLAFAVMFGANLAKYLPGGPWAQVGRVAWCARLGLPPGAAVLSTLLEAACQLGGAALVALAILPWLAPQAPWAQPAPLALAALAIALGMNPWTVDWARRLAERLGRRPLPAPRLPYPLLLGLLLAYAANAFLLGLGLAALAQAILPNPLSPLPALWLCGGFVLAWNAGALALFLPAGLGAREAALTAILALGPFPTGWPALLALAARAWTMVGEGFAFLVALPLARQAGLQGPSPSQAEQP